jgi:serine/threonine protein kinase
MEYVPGKSIHDMLLNVGPFAEDIVRNYTGQILQALAYCHSKNILHRDIKGKNILLDSQGTCKLADFGAAKLVDNLQQMGAPSQNYSYTPLWVAPEVLSNRYNSKVDIWSLGCVVIEMASGKDPWSERKFQSPLQTMFVLAQDGALPAFPPLSPKGTDFLKQCFTRDPQKRPSAAELLQHPWLAEETKESVKQDDDDEVELTQLEKALSLVVPSTKSTPSPNARKSSFSQAEKTAVLPSMPQGSQNAFTDRMMDASAKGPAKSASGKPKQ